MRVIIAFLLASCVVSLAQTSGHNVTNADLLTPFMVTNSAGIVFTDAVLVKLTPNKFFYKTPGGAMGSLPLAALPKDLQSKVTEAERKRVEEIKTMAERGDQNAMVAAGDDLFKKWQKELSDFSVTNKAFVDPGTGLARLDPNTGLPRGILNATNSVNYCMSMDWYRKAARMGNTNAMWRIVERNDEGDYFDNLGFLDPNTGLPDNVSKEGFSWLQELAKRGDSTATERVNAINSPRPAPTTLPSSVPDLEILDVRAKVTEANDVWWRWSYQLKARNNTQQSVHKYFHVLFLDADGFIIDKDSCDVNLSAGETKTFLGSEMVDLPAAERVKAVKAE